MSMPHVITFVLLCAVLIPAAVADYRTGRVPNLLTFGGIVAGLLLAGGLGWSAGGIGEAWRNLLMAVAGLLFAMAPAVVIYSLGGLGGGDVKLFGAVGAICGDWRCVVAAALYALVIAAGWALVLMIRHGLVKRTLRRLVTAGLMTLGRTKPTLPDDSPRVPIACGIAVGGILAGLEHLLNIAMPWSTYLY
jgi:prepilin peptidase CpaA